MKIRIRRYHPSFEPKVKLFEYEGEGSTLLEMLENIKTKDRTLTFNKGCRSGICGCCAVKVNGKEVLACTYEPKENDLVEPLSFSENIRDLVCSASHIETLLKRARAFLEKPSNKKQDEENEKTIRKQTECILCSSCHSSCPVYEVNKNFLGPFALTRSYRYVADIREEEKREKIEAVLKDGIWDCTLCGNCTEVCPQGIDPKNDILMLQGYAGRFGFQNPNLSSFGSFGLDF